MLDSNSGIYAYNYNNYNYNYYNYNIAGVIRQYGKVAIHKTGQRSEYARITKLYTIREHDAVGPEEFKSWISKFNRIIEGLSKKYECSTQHWQDRDE